jgi:hypothetical protein
VRFERLLDCGDAFIEAEQRGHLLSFEQKSAIRFH